jgi:hypothetical protein
VTVWVHKVLPFATVTLIGLWLITGRFVLRTTEGSMKVVVLPLSSKATSFTLPMYTKRGNVFLLQMKCLTWHVEISIIQGLLPQ